MSNTFWISATLTTSWYEDLLIYTNIKNPKTKEQRKKRKSLLLKHKLIYAITWMPMSKKWEMWIMIKSLPELLDDLCVLKDGNRSTMDRLYNLSNTYCIRFWLPLHVCGRWRRKLRLVMILTMAEPAMYPIKRKPRIQEKKKERNKPHLLTTC